MGEAVLAVGTVVGDVWRSNDSVMRAVYGRLENISAVGIKMAKRSETWHGKVRCVTERYTHKIFSDCPFLSPSRNIFHALKRE